MSDTNGPETNGPATEPSAVDTATQERTAEPAIDAEASAPPGEQPQILPAEELADAVAVVEAVDAGEAPPPGAPPAAPPVGSSATPPPAPPAAASSVAALPVGPPAAPPAAPSAPPPPLPPAEPVAAAGAAPPAAPPVAAPPADALPDRGSYVAALYMLAPFVPILASIITVALYFLRTTADPVVIYSGIASALVLWAVVAIPLMLYTSITRASATHFDALDVLIDQLDAKLGIAPGSGIVLDKEPPDESNSDPAAFKQALAVRNVIYKELRRRGLRWVTRKGYITLYSLLHEADPLLMQFEPVDQVAADTMHDRLRIAGSNIATGQQLLDNIAAGTRCLGPEAFLFFASKSDQQSAAGTIGDAAKLQAAARRMLGEVKSSVNTYRDNLWMSVATARNHLLITVLVVAFVTYLLVEFSAIGHVPPGDMLSAAILYLIGAIFGLLKRLSDESQTDHAVDDYGLTMARIVTSPVFSGLAAVAGVVLYFILLSYGTPAANLGSASPTISLSKVFDFANYPLDFVIAAIFGVAPNLIINYVQQQAKNYIGDIQSSEATHTTSSSK